MKKQMSTYKKSLIIFTSILTLLALIFLTYVYSNLKKYESNLLNPFLVKTINNLDKKTLTKYLEDASINNNLLNLYQEKTKRKDYVFKKINESTYEAYLDNVLFFTITVKNMGEESCLGLLKYEKYAIDNITPYLEKGLIYKTIEIPSNYALFVDNNPYNEKTREVEDEKLSFMYYQDVMPKLAIYELNNLAKEPVIEVYNQNNEKVDLEIDGNTYRFNERKKYDNIDSIKDFIGDFDITNVAKDWSLFLTKDLDGASYGFENFKKYLLPETNMYEKAYNWAHSIDITFTSSHTLKNPPFANIELENFTIYNDVAFSCEVYLEKNMVVKGVEQTDVMHDKLYFLKVNNEWKLMNIKGVTEGAFENE